MDANAIIDRLRQAVPGATLEPAAAVDQPTIYVDRESWHEVARALRNDPELQFQFVADVTAGDYFPRDPRFEVVYLLASLGIAGIDPGPVSAPKRLRVKVRVPGADPHVATISDIWPGTNWPEREVFDLFGITFDNHPDLRRVLMPEDWEGHPLRKDYPVQIKKAVKVYEPLQVSPEQFASDLDRIRRVSMETGNAGIGREDEGEVGQRIAETPTRKTDERYERKPE